MYSELLIGTEVDEVTSPRHTTPNTHFRYGIRRF